MPKFPTFPTLYDECKTVSISDLKRLGYLNPNQYTSGTLTWSRRGNKTGSISIATFISSESPFLLLDYKCDDKPINYRVQLVSIPSNIGKGIVWYFICPRTGKRCRKLYLADTYFYHRSAFTGCMYEKQTYSHKNRKMIKSFEMAFGVDDIYEQLYSKNFKRYYAGKPTKRFLKLMKKARQAGEIDFDEFLKK